MTGGVWAELGMQRDEIKSLHSRQGGRARAREGRRAYVRGPVSHGLPRPGLSGSVEGLGGGNSSVSQRISAACPVGLIH